MNAVFFAIVLVAFLVGGYHQWNWVPSAADSVSPMAALGTAMVDAAGGAVTLAIGLVGMMALFLGLMRGGRGWRPVDHHRVVVSTGRPIRCPRSDDQEGEGARPATVEAGVWLPSASARGECVLPVHVDRRRLSSGTQFIGATA